jgi:hypothetical protein
VDEIGRRLAGVMDKPILGEEVRELAVRLEDSLLEGR